MEQLYSNAVIDTRSVSRPSTLRRARSTRAERNLERITSGARVIDVHRGDTRDWWDLAAEKVIDKALADPRFGDYVKVIQICTDMGLEEVSPSESSN